MDYLDSGHYKKFDDTKHFELIMRIFNVHCSIDAHRYPALRDKAWDYYITKILNFGIERMDWSIAASMLIRMCKLSTIDAYKYWSDQHHHNDVSLDQVSRTKPLNAKKVLSDYLIDDNWSKQYNSIEIEEWWDLVTEKLTDASRETLDCIVESEKLTYKELRDSYPHIFKSVKHVDNRMYVLRKELKRNLEAIQAICPSPI
jgi:hypothetical protein